MFYSCSFEQPLIIGKSQVLDALTVIYVTAYQLLGGFNLKVSLKSMGF
ncbi:hypothetical protein [Bartonella queenslandensis]|nr:hypothetical protein [Bartonella queenslandensis]